MAEEVLEVEQHEEEEEVEEGEEGKENQEKNIYKILEKIYYDPKDPGSYGGIDKLYRRARELLPNLLPNKSTSSRSTPKKPCIRISKSLIKRFLQAQASYTLHRPARRNFTRNRTRV